MWQRLAVLLFLLLSVSLAQAASATQGTLKLYADFNDGKLPTYADWGKGWDQSTVVTNVTNGQLIVTPKPGLSEGRQSFGNGASTIEYDFKIENVNAISPHFHIDLFNLAKMQETSTLWPYVAVVARFPSLSGVPTPDIGFYVGKWDAQQKKVASVFYDKSAGGIQIGKTYRARLSWIDNRIAFSLDGTEVASYTFTQSYSQSLQPKPDAYNTPGYITFDSNWVVAGSGNDFKWTIDNIFTDVDFSASTTPTAPISLSGLSLACPSTINASASGSCTATASYSDASSKAVSPTWSSSNPTALSVSSSGSLVAGTPATDTIVTVSASYAENGVTKNASQNVTVKAVAAAWPLEYIDNKDGTVTHKTTGLTWKRCVEGNIWDGSTCTGTARTYTWNQAWALGSNDWGLPTMDQLRSIVEPGHFYPGCDINQTVFPNSCPWSDGSQFWLSETAYFMSFAGGSGGVVASTKSLTLDNFYVRLVRGGQSGAVPTTQLAAPQFTITPSEGVPGTKLTVGGLSASNYELCVGKQSGDYSLGCQAIWTGETFTMGNNWDYYVAARAVNGKDKGTFSAEVHIFATTASSKTYVNAISFPTSNNSVRKGQSNTLLWDKGLIGGSTVDIYYLNGSSVGISAIPDNSVLTRAGLVSIAKSQPNTGSYMFQYNGNKQSPRIVVVGSSGTWSISTPTTSQLGTAPSSTLPPQTLPLVHMTSDKYEYSAGESMTLSFQASPGTTYKDAKYNLRFVLYAANNPSVAYSFNGSSFQAAETYWIKDFTLTEIADWLDLPLVFTWGNKPIQNQLFVFRLTLEDKGANPIASANYSVFIQG